MRKIAIIGFGNIGNAIFNQLICHQDNLEIALYDVNQSALYGKYLDIAHSLAMLSNCHVKCVCYDNQIDAIKNSDAVIITAGKRRLPTMTREDLLLMNAEVIGEIANNVASYAREAFVILVTNPLDVMSYYFLKISKLPRNKVVGMSGLLDSTRFRVVLANQIGCNVNDIKAMVIGSHNDSMFLLESSLFVNGMNIKELIDNRILTMDDLKLCIQQTRSMGMTISDQIGTSAYVSPAVAAVEMMKAYLYNKNIIISAAFYLENEYQLNDLTIGMPICINSNGCTLVQSMDFTNDEIDALHKSAISLRSLYSQLNHL